MRTTDEMVLAVHERMDVLQRKQENRRISFAGGGCAVLGAVTIALIARFGGTMHAALPAEFAGASLLAEETAGKSKFPAEIGGYVLIALAAFMAGAAVTVFIRARRRKQAQKETADRE